MHKCCLPEFFLFLVFFGHKSDSWMCRFKSFLVGDARYFYSECYSIGLAFRWRAFDYFKIQHFNYYIRYTTEIFTNQWLNVSCHISSTQSLYSERNDTIDISVSCTHILFLHSYNITQKFKQLSYSVLYSV